MRCAGLLLAIGYLGLLQPVWAQTGVPAKTQHARYLVLERKWPFKRIRFYPGEKLAFKLKHESGWNRGTIQAVHKSSLVIVDAEIPFSDIRKIRTARSDYLGGFATLSANSLISGGILWVVLGGIRELEGTGDGGEWLAGAGAGAVLLGLATRQLTRHTWRVGRNYRLKSI